MRETRLRHCFKRTASPMWTASGSVYPRTLRRIVCVYCSSPTTYPILSHGWWGSSTSRCVRGIEVLAVEIKRFHGKSGQTLVPRVIGRRSVSPAPGRPGQRLTRKSFLDGFADESVRGVAERLLDVGIGIRLRYRIRGLVWAEHSSEMPSLATTDQCCLAVFRGEEGMDAHAGLLVRGERARV